MDKIKKIHARQVLDCKARPAVEVDVITEHGYSGTGCAPTGTSVGSYESFIIRDNDPNHYFGMGVQKAVRIVNEDIAPALIGMDVCDQKAIDETMILMDGTPNKEKLGGNNIYSVSIACMKAAASSQNMETAEYIACTRSPIKTLPVTSFNLINGGKFATHTMPFNETMLVPYKASSVEEMVEIGVCTFQMLKTVIKEYYHVEPTVGASYGWVFPTNDPEDNLKMLAEAVNRCGFSDKVGYAFDCASSEMYNRKDNTYELKGKRVSSEDIISYVKNLTERWDLVFVEDLLDENDWEGFSAAHKALTRTIVIGDDFIATNPDRLKKAVETKCIDGFILKPNQIGSLTEAFTAFDYAKANNIVGIPSGRSGGVLGDIVADLAVALQVPFMKTGCPKSGERIAKINYLLTLQDRHPEYSLADLGNIVRF